jgi:hypothetical protein
MGDQVRSAAERRWRGHLTAWRNSGLNQAAYCRREGLVANDFSRWKGELAHRDALAAKMAPTFIPVQVAAASEPSYAFEVALRGGRVLRFGARVELATLDALARALEDGDAC